MNDIPELYKRFDGNAGDYQELRRDDLAADAQQRWPLVAAVASTPVVMPPRVFRGPAAVPPASHLPAAASVIPDHPSGHATASTARRAVPLAIADAPAVATAGERALTRTSLRARLAAAWRTFKSEGRS